MSEAVMVPVAGEVEGFTAADLLAFIRSARETENRAAAEQLVLAAQWADLHPPESIHDAATFSVVACGQEHEEPIAGEGTPLVRSSASPSSAVSSVSRRRRRRS
jgi:hypothetical protein